MHQDLSLLSVISGLSKEEFTIYSQMLRMGFATTSYISEYSRMNEQRVKSILNNLERKNLVQKSPGIIEKYIPLRPYNEFFNALSQFNSNIHSTLQGFEHYDLAQKNYFIKITNEIQSQVDYFVEKSTQTLNAGSQQAVSALEESLKKNIIIIENTSISIPAMIKENLSQSYEEFVSDSKIEAEKYTKQAQKSMSLIIQELKAFLDDTQARVSKVSSTVDAEINQFSNNLSQNILNMNKQLITDIEEFNEGFKSKIIEFTQAIDNYLNEVQSKIKKTNTEMDSLINEKITVIKTNIQNFQQKSNKSISEEFSKIQNDLHTKSDLLQTSVKKSTDSIIELFDNSNGKLTKICKLYRDTSTEFDSKVKNLLSNYKKDITHNFENLEEKINSRAISISKDISQEYQSEKIKFIEKLAEKSGKIINSSINDTNNSLSENLNKEISTIKEDIGINLSKKRDEFTEKVRKQIANNAELKILCAELIPDIEKLINYSLEEFNRKSLGLKESIKVNFDKFSAENGQLNKIIFENELSSDFDDFMISKMEKLNEKIMHSNQKYVKDQLAIEKQLISESADNLMNQFEDLSSKNLNSINELEREFHEKINDAKNELTSKKNTVIESLNNDEDSNSDEFKKIGKNTEENLKLIIEPLLLMLPNLNEEFSKMQTEIKESFNNSIYKPEIDSDTLKILFNQNLDSITNLYNSKNSEFTSVLQKYTEKWSELINEFTPKIVKSLEFSEKKLGEEIETFLAIQQRYHERFLEVINSNEKKISENSSLKLSEIKTLFEQDYEQLQLIISKYFEDFKEFIANSTKKMRSNTNSLLEDSQKELKLFSDKEYEQIKSELSKLSGLGDKSTVILRKSWNEIFPSDLLEIENSWVIPGRQNMMNYVLDMIKRAKKSIIISFPVFEMFDLRRLASKHKNGVTVRFLTRCDLISKRKKEQALKQGIELYDSQDTDLIMALRDVDEEMLIAPLPLKKNEIALLSKKGTKVSLPQGSESKSNDVSIVSCQKEVVGKLTQFLNFLEKKAKPLKS